MGRLAATAALVALAAAAACGGGSAASSAAPDVKPAPRILTERHHGKTFTLRVGREVSLRLPSATEDEPDASTRAVSFAPVDYLVDPGYREWVVTAERPGRTVVTVRTPGRQVRIVLVVRA